MAGNDWTTADALKLDELLSEDPYRFGFFQVLRRIECLHRDRPRIGEARRLAEEYLRLGQDPSLEFAPATLSSYQRQGRRHPRIGVAFMGLFGPNGPLPLHLTEYAHDRIQHAHDRTFASFADIFHHRMLSLFYRAWAQAQPAVSFDRPEEDRFGEYVASLMGLGMPAFKQRDAAPDLAKLYYCGHYSLQTKNESGLRSLLADYFEVPVRINEFQGSWIEIPEPEWTRLGESEETATLGISTIVGSRLWDRQLKFRVVCGRMGLEDYARLLPGSPSLPRMKALVRNYIGDEFVWDLQLILKHEEIPELELGGSARLGLTSWLISKPPTRDADELVLDPERLPVSTPTQLAKAA